MITDERPGSLLSVLRERNLSVSIESIYSCMNGIALFTIQCNLTNDGVNQVDDVINLIFQVKLNFTVGQKQFSQIWQMSQHFLFVVHSSNKRQRCSRMDFQRA